MKKLRKLFCAIFAAAIAFCFSINSFAYSIDGYVDPDTEWNKAPYENVSENVFSGCYIDYLLVRYDFQPQKNVLYLAVQTVEGSAAEDTSNCRFEITIGDSTPITISPNGDDYDSDLYSVKSGFFDFVDGVSMEAKITFNIGVDNEIDVKIAATDSHGETSKLFKVAMQDKTVESPVESSQEADNSDKGKSSSPKSESSKKTSSKKKTSANSNEPYHTVDPDEYVTAEDATDIDVEAEEYTEEEAVNVAAAATRENSTGKIVLKTVSVGMLVISAIAFVTVMRRNKRP